MSPLAPAGNTAFLEVIAKGPNSHQGEKKKKPQKNKNKTKQKAALLLWVAQAMNTPRAPASFICGIVKDRAQHGAEEMPWQWYPTGAEYVESDSHNALPSSCFRSPRSQAGPSGMGCKRSLGWLVLGG